MKIVYEMAKFPIQVKSRILQCISKHAILLVVKQTYERGGAKTPTKWMLCTLSLFCDQPAGNFEEEQFKRSDLLQASKMKNFVQKAW